MRSFQFIHHFIRYLMRLTLYLVHLDHQLIVEMKEMRRDGWEDRAFVLVAFLVGLFVGNSD